jgi:hypothetical protein
MDLPRLGTCHNNEEVEVAVRESLRMQEPDISRDGTVKLVPRRDKRITALGDCVDK